MGYVRQPESLEQIGDCPEVVDLMERLEKMPASERAACAMNLASRFVEFAAYEMARAHTPANVAHMMLVAADLESKSHSMMPFQRVS